MIWLSGLVGRQKITLFVAIAFLVGLIFWTMIQYGASKETARIVTEQHQNYISTRKRIDNATNTPLNDVDSARSRLLQRQIDQ